MFFKTLITHQVYFISLYFFVCFLIIQTNLFKFLGSLLLRFKFQEAASSYFLQAFLNPWVIQGLSTTILFAQFLAYNSVTKQWVTLLLWFIQVCLSLSWNDSNNCCFSAWEGTKGHLQIIWTSTFTLRRILHISNGNDSDLCQSSRSGHPWKFTSRPDCAKTITHPWGPPHTL